MIRMNFQLEACDNNSDNDNDDDNDKMKQQASTHVVKSKWNKALLHRKKTRLRWEKRTAGYARHDLTGSDLHYSLRRRTNSETPASESLYDGQFTISTQLIRPNPHSAAFNTTAKL